MRTNALRRALLESRGLYVFDPLLPEQGPAFARGLLVNYHPALHTWGAGSHRMAAVTFNPRWWPQGPSARDRHLCWPLPLCTAAPRGPLPWPPGAAALGGPPGEGPTPGQHSSPRGIDNSHDAMAPVTSQSHPVTVCERQSCWDLPGTVGGRKYTRTGLRSAPGNHQVPGF